MRLFKDDPNYSILLELATIGAHIDTDSSFINQSEPEAFRDTEVKLTKVFQKHAIDAWSKGRGLLLRRDTLEETGQMFHLHFNSNHLVYKWSDVLGRWCIDPSHRSDDNLPLNGGDAKQLSIDRYQKTWSASLVDMLSAFSDRKIRLNLPWSAFWIFKEDIKSCFPQMDMSPKSAVLLAMRITAAIVFIHLAGSFGWTGAPMAWAIIGTAMLRICLLRYSSIIDLFLICDDFVGFGLLSDALTVSSFVRSLIIDVCGPDSVALDKSILAQQADVIGWEVNLLDPNGASIRPKTDAIAKMCYYFFSFDVDAPQPLILWQILHSYAERYSQGLRGLRCFVSPFAHMIRATGPNPITSKSKNLFAVKHQYAVKKVATASTKFCIEMWRVASYRLFLNPSVYNVSIEQFLSMNGVPGAGGIEFDSVSDASPYRICAAIYHHGTSSLLAWTSVLLPFEADKSTSYQCNREYLGLLITFFLIAKAFPSRLSSSGQPPISFKWINDNTGALAWGDALKVKEIPSLIANTVVSTFQITTNISLVGSEHLPGIWMGDIDHESRREEHLAAGDYHAPSLLPHLFIDLESDINIMNIISRCSPFKAAQYKVKDFHSIFLEIHGSLRKSFQSI